LHIGFIRDGKIGFEKGNGKISKHGSGVFIQEVGIKNGIYCSEYIKNNYSNPQENYKFPALGKA
jgi:hypothetical protein